jgi:short-subunit dehydrogenase
MTTPWKVAWITGASSGIGSALAIELAHRGVRIAASARREDELARLATEHPAITAFPLDVTDQAQCRAVHDDIRRQLGDIDLAVLNAGVGKRMGVADFDPALAAWMMAVNYQGVVNGLAALMPAMTSRKHGQLALVSSLAGYRGFPRAAGYSASKAAVISLAESLRPELEAAGVGLSVVNPGYVSTPMTANATHPLPYLMSSEEAARRIVRGLEASRRTIAFPWQMSAACNVMRALPDRLFFWLMRRAGS